MGHPDPFPLKYIAIGNEDCISKYSIIYPEYYILFYKAVREAYPKIQIISNCDGSVRQLHHPADLYDYNIYDTATRFFLRRNTFDMAPRTGPKAFVNEYAAKNEIDPGNANLFVSLAEAAFLTALEKNCDVVQMASYAPFFVNDNDRNWLPDAIVFNSWQQYGTPSYWMQTFSRESSGPMIHPITISSNYSDSLVASAITWNDTENSFLRIQIVNFGSGDVNLTISAAGLQGAVNKMKSRVTLLTSSNVMDGNSFSTPNNVVPVSRELPDAGLARSLHVHFIRPSSGSKDMSKTCE